MIDFAHILAFPARGSAANGCSEVLFKKLTVQGGSDISAVRATGRSEPRAEDEQKSTVALGGCRNPLSDTSDPRGKKPQEP